MIRNELIKKDDQLKDGFKKQMSQEAIISEMRSFIEEHRYAIEIINDKLTWQELPEFNL